MRITRLRPHQCDSALGYVSSNEFETLHTATNIAA